MAKLTATEWANVRAVWERDTRKGFRWIVRELALNVSEQCVRARAIREEWEKVETTPNNTPKTTPKKRTEHASGRRQPSTDKKEDEGGLTARERVFIGEYLKDFNATRSAIASGYSPKTAKQQGSRLLTKVNVKEEIERQTGERLNALSIDADEVLRGWADVVNFDVNEIMQYRRVPCPFCYSSDGQPQYTLRRFMEEKAEYERTVTRGGDGAENPSFLSANSVEFIDETRSPNCNCRVCHGMGVGLPFIADTRKLSPVGKRLYAGFETNRGAVNVVIQSKEKALEGLAKALGVYREKEETNVNVSFDPKEWDEIYKRGQRQAYERQKEVFDRRGIEYDKEELKAMYEQTED